MGRGIQLSIPLRREDFITQYPPFNCLNPAEVEHLWERPEIHLYVHIPFCVKKCGFCYYKSFPLGDSPVPDEYLDALKSEIAHYSAMPEVQSKRIRSVYLGGGTPTLMNEKQLESLMEFILSHFDFAPDFEFCCEARPGPETSYTKLKMLKSLGMRRLSLGCQSLDDQVLAVNGRNHNSKDFYETFERARQAGLYSINVDIMSGMIGQTLESWMRTVRTIAGLKPENVAIYKMEVYFNNALFLKIRTGNSPLMSDTTEAELAKRGYQELLASGYLLADNFSFTIAPEYNHVHRRETWKGADMLGVGLSSHSCFNGYIYQNEIRLPEYLQDMEKGELSIKRAHKVSVREEMIQRVVFSLKNLHFPRATFVEDFGVDVMSVFSEQLTHLEEEGFVRIRPDCIETTFEGALFADDIVRELYLPEHRTMMLGHLSRTAI